MGSCCRKGRKKIDLISLALRKFPERQRGVGTRLKSCAAERHRRLMVADATKVLLRHLQNTRARLV
jgi:hypothetical protein